MKQFFAIILATAILLSLTACNASRATVAEMSSVESTTSVASTTEASVKPIELEPASEAIILDSITLSAAEEVYNILMDNVRDFYVYLDDDELSIVQEFIRETEPDGKENMSGYYCPYWVIQEYKLFLNHERNLEVRNGPWLLEVQSLGNADYTGWWNTYVAYDDATWIPSESGVSRYELGIEKEYSIKGFEYPKFEGWNSNHGGIFLSSGSKFGLLDIKTGEFTQFCDDYAGTYRTFCQSLYYIGVNGSLFTVNMLTGENTPLLPRVYDLVGSDSIRAETKSGTKLIYYYVNWDGQYVNWYEDGIW